MCTAMLLRPLSRDDNSKLHFQERHLHEPQSLRVGPRDRPFKDADFPGHACQGRNKTLRDEIRPQVGPVH